MEFYVSIKGEKSGPFTNYEISGMLREGEIDGDSLVWVRGQDGWEKLREVPALKSTSSESVADDVEENSEEAQETEDGNPLPGTRTPAKKISIPIAHEVRPLTRFWARSFDYTLVTVFVWSISDVVPPPELMNADLTFADFISRLAEESQKEEHREVAILGLKALFFWHFLEGILLRFFGTTPGKALFGIKVKNDDGSPVSLLPAIARSFYVYVAGVGFYMFPFSIILMAVGFFRLMTTGKTFWDNHLKMTVEHPPLGFARILLAIGAFLVLMIVHSLKFS